MPTTVRNFLALLAGYMLGAFVNMGLIMLGSMIIAAPEGYDPSSADSLKDNIHLFQPQHFIFPFLAHAIGTLVGAFVATKLAVSFKLFWPLFIGFLFFTGGVTLIWMVGGPLWFTALDLIFAYFPMAWLGYKLAR